jgi:hypothetical protein
MFKGNTFDVLEFNMPVRGMNQNIAPEVLDSTQAYLLENILPLPLGEGRVRYGTQELAGVTLPADSTLQEIFDFTKADGSQELLLYVQTFQIDARASNFAVLSDTQVRFTTPTPETYHLNTPLKVIYTKNGQQILYTEILEKGVAGNQVTLTFAPNSFPDPVEDIVLNSLWFATGTLYHYDFNATTLLKEHLAPHSVPRCVQFKNHLVICNGVDRMMTWDGSALKVVEDFVEEQATSFHRLGSRRFSFTTTQAFQIEKYKKANKIQLMVNGMTHELTCASVEKADLTVTLTVQEDLPVFREEDRVALFYRDFPPAFSALFVLHNRLWALGEGPVGLSYRSNPLTVYFCSQAESLTHWFDSASKHVPFLDIGYKHGKPDNLEAIASVGPYMAFIGRSHTQVWQGTNPLEVETFKWKATLEGGIAHGNLLLPLANDVFFISPQGLMSFGTLNEAQQVELKSLNAVDPLIRDYTDDLLRDDMTYRQARAFHYKEGPFAGFKIGPNKIIVALTDTGLTGWTVFTGDFKQASSFNEGCGFLILGIENRLYRYSDGKKAPPDYADARGGAIPFIWMLPKLSFKGKKFASKRFVVEGDLPSSFVLEKANHLHLEVSGNLRETFDIEQAYPVSLRGDPLGGLPLAVNDEPETLALRLDQPYSRSKGRAKFVSTEFWLILRGQTKQGPLRLKKLQLYGRKER